MVCIVIKRPGKMERQYEKMGADAQRLINTIEKVLPTPEIRIEQDMVNVVFTSKD